jgi:hypothetical protein
MNENGNKIKIKYSKNLHPFALVVRLAIFKRWKTTSVDENPQRKYKMTSIQE